MQRHTCWGCATSFTVLLRQFSTSAGGAIQSCGSVTVGPLHYLHPFLAATIKQGFCTKGTPHGSTDGKIVKPGAALENGCSSDGPISWEGRVEDDNMDRAGVSSNQMQRRDNGLREVVANAQVAQATRHTASDAADKPSAGCLLSYLAKEGFKPIDLDALPRKYPFVTKLDPGRGRSVVEFFYELGLSSTDVVKLVGKYPKVLSLSVMDRMRPLVEWLLQYVDRSQLGIMLTKFPNILGLSINDNLQPKMEWLLQYVDRSKIGSMMKKHPNILGLSMNDNLQPTIEWLLQYVDRSKIGSMMKKYPNILGLSMNDNLQPTIEWLLQYVDSSKIGSMLTRHPGILTRSIDDNLQVTLDHLVDLGLKHENKHKVFQNGIFSFSITAIDAKFDVLRNIYGLPEAFIKDILNKCPDRLTRDILANFNSYLAVGFTRDEIKSMVMNSYMALGFNVRNTTYHPKLQFYLEVAQYKIQDIADYPLLLMPRMEIIEGRMDGIKQAFACHPTPEEFHQVLCMRPKRFEKYLEEQGT